MPGTQRAQRTGICIPLAQWPGMWQPTSSGRVAGRIGRHGPDHVDPLARVDDDAQPGDVAGTLTTGVGPGGVPTVAASATSQAAWTAASPMTASWTSSPPLITWSRTVSPGTRSSASGRNE